MVYELRIEKKRSFCEKTKKTHHKISTKQKQPLETAEAGLVVVFVTYLYITLLNDDFKL